jgi:hypothetical protein
MGFGSGKRIDIIGGQIPILHLPKRREKTRKILSDCSTLIDAKRRKSACGKHLNQSEKIPAGACSKLLSLILYMHSVTAFCRLILGERTLWSA